MYHYFISYEWKFLKVLITGWCIILDATPRHESDNRLLWEGTLRDHWGGYAYNTGRKVPFVSGLWSIWFFPCTKAVSLWSYMMTLFFMILCRPDCYWWKGQNKRTSEVGTFPRHCVDPQRKLGGQCQRRGVHTHSQLFVEQFLYAKIIMQCHI